MSSRKIPLPPEPALLDPLLEIWGRGTPLIRCHNVTFGATEFNPGFGRGRFHPFADPEGRTVPSLYGASTLEGALSETIFHDVPVRGPIRRVRSSTLRPMVLSTVAARRDLVLAQLHSHGLRRLEMSRLDLIDSSSRTYPSTALWAQALHRGRQKIDGLVWVSRLHDTSRSLVLFGDRVARHDLEVIESPLPLFEGRGLRKVRQAAEETGITLISAS